MIANSYYGTKYLGILERSLTLRAAFHWTNNSDFHILFRLLQVIKRSFCVQWNHENTFRTLSDAYFNSKFSGHKYFNTKFSGHKEILIRTDDNQCNCSPSVFQFVAQNSFWRYKHRKVLVRWGKCARVFGSTPALRTIH